MLNLLELVVGVAVMCEDKNVFIPKIFELNDHSQVSAHFFSVFASYSYNRLGLNL